jgi:hypothetical protein
VKSRDECRNVTHVPKRIRYSSSHRGRYPQGPVDTNEIVVHVMQADCVRVIFDLLAECVRQPVKRRIDMRMVRFWRST